MGDVPPYYDLRVGAYQLGMPYVLMYPWDVSGSFYTYPIYTGNPWDDYQIQLAVVLTGSDES